MPNRRILPVLLASFGAIGGVSFSIAAASTAHAASTISRITPDPVELGDAVTVEGTCATPGDDAVNIFVQIYDSTGTVRADLSAPVAADDSFAATITIPAASTTGTWAAEVECGYADHDVSVSPRVEFAVVEPAPGQTPTPSSVPRPASTPSSTLPTTR